MATRGPSYGLSRECKMKALAKFDIDQSIAAMEWIEEVLGEPLVPPSDQIEDQYGIQDALKNGQVLCRLINTLQPGLVKTINTNKMAFKEMENIELFLRGCRQYGMNEVDVFQTQDLYECKAMYSVINCMYSLGSLAQKNGFTGPVLGVKIAEQNVRQFSDEQLNESKKVIGLQYGTNRVASQKGMTPYGATRKM